MVTNVSIAQIGSLVGDSARVAMLQALMGGKALTASELAIAAGITPQTTSGHLAQLSAASLISVTKQGRHRYHRLASPQVAALLESLMLVASGADGTVQTGPRDAGMRLARTCYDHVAGWVGVSLADAAAARGWIEIGEDSASVTPAGLDRFTSMGIDAEAMRSAGGRSKPICRPCLDWSERRPHLAGRLGAALCTHGLSRGWIRKRADTRALDVTPAGWRALKELFDISRPSGA